MFISEAWAVEATADIAMGAVEASQPAWPDKPESMFIVEQEDCSVDYDCFGG